MTAEAQKGNGFAMYDLGKIHLDKEQGDAAQGWFRKAHRAFLAEESKDKKPGCLRYRIGKLYALGHGVEQDYTAAARWYGKALREENPFAAYALGCLYLRGQGVEQDDAQAFDLFYQAANHEGKPNAYAAYELGKMCEKGIGIRADEPAAHKWYQQAYTGFLSIKRQFADDKLYYRLGHMNLTGKGRPVDIPQAARYFEKAAKLGNADAEYQLGKLFLHGKEVAQDQARAIAYLTSAAEHGHAYAAQLLQRFYEKDNWTVTASALSLLQQTARIFEDKLQEYYTPQAGRTDRKLLSKIAEKKLAQGQKPQMSRSF